MRRLLLIVFFVLVGYSSAFSRLYGRVTLSHRSELDEGGVEGFSSASLPIAIGIPLEVTCSSEPVLKDSVKADTLVALAKSQLGKNYCYAVSDPDKGFDCSGFVYYVFNSFKIEVPRSSKLYKNFGQKIEMDSARVGDVIVFTGTNAKKRSPGHVGIVLSCENGIPTFIHSSSGKKKGVIISDFNESPYYKKRFIKIVRVATVY